MTITLMTNACQQLNQKKSEQMVPFKIREIAKCTLLPFFLYLTKITALIVALSSHVIAEIPLQIRKLERS